MRASLPGSDRPIGPMRGPELLETVASVYRANARSVIVITALITTPAYAVSTWLTSALVPIAERITDPATLSGQRVDPAILGDVGNAILLAFAFLALDQLAICLVAVALTLAVGRPGEVSRTPAATFRDLARQLPRLLVMVILILLGFLGLLGVWIGLQLALALAMGPGALTAGGPGAFLGLLAAVGVVAAAIFVLARWALASPSLALEGLGPAAALGRSWRLVSGQTWRILGYGVLIWVIVLILDLMIVISVAAVVSLVAPAAVRGIEIGFGAIAQALLVPFLALTSIVLYHDARLRPRPPERGG